MFSPSGGFGFAAFVKLASSLVPFLHTRTFMCVGLHERTRRKAVPRINPIARKELVWSISSNTGRYLAHLPCSMDHERYK